MESNYLRDVHIHQPCHVPTRDVIRDNHKIWPWNAVLAAQDNGSSRQGDLLDDPDAHEPGAPVDRVEGFPVGTVSCREVMVFQIALGNWLIAMSWRG
jgi:hypothetical protein